MHAPMVIAGSSSPFLARAAGSWLEGATVWQLPERFVGWLHEWTPDINETLFRWLACILIILLAILLRRVVTNVIFAQVSRLVKQVGGVFDGTVIEAIKPPMAALVMVWGIFTALIALNLAPAAESLVKHGALVAVTAVLLWGAFAAGAAALNHLEKVAWNRGLGIATFMPLIRKTLAAIFAVICGLALIASFGVDVRTFLAGLGIGGLAVALAAQDTIANMFGSFVVVMDHPFRIGDTVRIAGNEGTVEDIGLRSTRLRTGARTLIVIPNKTVAGEAITNLSRMPQRRVDQTIGLTYDTTPEKMEDILADLRAILKADPDVHQTLVVVNFVAFGESTLDIQLVYFTASPDWAKHLQVRERINLKIMRAVEARGLEFAFPTQTVIHQNSDGS